MRYRYQVAVADVNGVVVHTKGFYRRRTARRYAEFMAAPINDVTLTRHGKTVQFWPHMDPNEYARQLRAGTAPPLFSGLGARRRR